MEKNFNLLNTIQFFDALNENLFKYLVVYFLIFYQGDAQTSNIMALTGAIFILPFLLFSTLGGILADRWSKTIIIRITRLIQVVFMILAFTFIVFRGSNFIYFALFIITTLSAIFGPSKYGIISEVSRKEQIVKANGYVAAFTFFGIILGSAFASLLVTFMHKKFHLMIIFCIALSILGSILSFCMSKTKVLNPNKKWPRFIYKEMVDSLKEMAKIPYMLTAVFAFSYFIFIGAFIQMNIIPYSVSALHENPIIGGYLFMFASIGIGIGALIATQFSGRLTSLPWSLLGISIGCFLFTLFPSPFWLNVIWVIGSGIAGGLFLVPSQTFILKESFPETKGRNFGTANFFSFLFALFAAGVLYLFNSTFGLTPSMSFTWIAILNTIIAILFFFLTRSFGTHLTQ